VPTKQKGKTRFFVLIALSFLLFLSGCGEFKDIDKMVFVSMIGIDKSDNPKKPYKIILKLYVPTSSFRQNPTPQYSYLIKDGETLAETIAILEAHLDKELDFGHSKLIVLGEKMMEDEKNKEILDFLIRRPDIQMISYVAMGRPNAEEIVKFVPNGETSLQPTLFNYFGNTGAESSFIITTHLFDFRRTMNEYGIDPILPIVEINEPGSHFIIDKSIILAKDRIPYELDAEKTLFVKILADSAKSVFFTVEREGEHFVTRLDNIKPKYRVERDGNQVTIRIKIKLTGIITESRNTLDNRKLPEYNRMLEQEMKEKLNALIDEMKMKGYDPFGFGLRLQSHTLPKDRMTDQEWRTAFKNAKVEVVVKSNLKSTGSIQ